MSLGFTTMDCVPEYQGLAKIAAILSSHCSMPIWTFPSCDQPQPEVFRYAYFRVVAAQLFEGD